MTSHVVIAGGGVAALEAALALRDLAGDRVTLTIATESTEFVYRPYAVVRPFQSAPTYRIDLFAIARDVGAEIISATAGGIEPESSRLLLSGREPLPYDALVIAIGADAEATLVGGTMTPWDWGGGHAFRAMLASLRDGRTKAVTFVVPGGTVWALPLYELALLTSAYVLEESIERVSLTLVTVEKAPLEVFGAKSSARVADVLRDRGITVLLESETLDVDERHVRTSTGAAIQSDVTVSVPVIRPRAFSGVAIDHTGFIAVDEYCRVGHERMVFAAGDCTNHPLKQGGIAAQQADTAAEGIAASVGAGSQPAPLRPRLHAVLFTGEKPLELGEPAAGPAHERDGVAEPLAKIDARYLTPYLRAANPPLPTLAG